MMPRSVSTTVETFDRTLLAISLIEIPLLDANDVPRGGILTLDSHPAA